MTVSTEVDHNEYTGNGVTTSFPYTFRIFQKSDLVVQVVDLNENITELILDTDYTVTGAGGYVGGNVIMATALPSGYQISISRSLPVTQETDLRNQGKFFAEVHEDAFDKLTMLVQQVRSFFNLALRKPSSIANWYDALNNYIRNLRDPIQDQDAATKKYVDNLSSSNLNRTLRVPESFIQPAPSKDQRKNKISAWDYNGDPVAVLPESGSAADVLLELMSPNGASMIGSQNGETVQEFISEIKSNEGASAIGTENGGTVQEWIVKTDSASYRAKNISKLGYVDYQVHNRGSIKVLCQGDSTTAGYDMTSTDSVPPSGEDWARHATMTYPDRFESFLSEQSGCTVSKVVRAISGYTAKQAYENTNWQSNPGCDAAILMYGINDSQGVDGATLDSYMEFMEKLIRRFIDWEMGVIVCMPASGGQGAGSPLWLQWARRMRNLAEIYGCPCFNAHEVQLYRHAASVQSDSTHFNSMGYAILGEMLASMFMAGGLLPYYRPVVNETTVWPGMMAENIGWCDRFGNVSTSRDGLAYTRDKIVGALPSGQRSQMTFSFYLDAEAAHIYGKFQGTINTIMSNGKWWNNNAKTYYQYSPSQNTSYAMQMQRNALTGNAYTSVDGASMFVGRVLGRGWHTITLYNAPDGSDTAAAFVNSITVSPLPSGMSTDAMWSRDDERRVKVVHCKKIPSPLGAGTTVPSAVTLTSFFVRAPQSIAGTAGAGAQKLPRVNNYNTGFAKLRIVNSSGSYCEAVVVKTTSGDSAYSVVMQSNNFPTNNVPVITCSLATNSRRTIVAKDAEGTNQPIESIYDSDAGVTAIPATGSVSLVNGLYLLFNLSWPSGSPYSYWNIEVEGSDWFGNSETSFGVL
ncbi:SGNH/GDSL hydrolase family protein [Escherichia fergusonii]|uniref:SGNH/GDSL hydrolase family protein n=1 Tax=Escherichia fergusonii TaxID=564 RepID=UPI0015E4F294|nr:SGNH/GDSL hydrolase family protein [Escherichia fergusonii]MBA8579766.1 hypothetical protein [Escherichia fergusonii]QLM34131.1 hypothetical protein HVV65_07155 [Escherichia fergusonii]